MDVSIIIVNYNTKTLLKNCLKSVYDNTTDVSFEVIVSDNGSKDGSLEMIKAEFPSVVLLENNANIGFGAGNNRALAIAKGKFIFYLNSDTVLINNALSFFLDYWLLNNEKFNLGALGANLLNPDGSIQHSCADFPNIDSELKDTSREIFVNIKRIFNYYVFKHKRAVNKTIIPMTTGDVDTIVGAALFLKNDSFAHFDERFFMNYEETDLLYQIKKSEKKNMLIDGPKIIHFGGASSFEGHTNDLLKYANFSKIHFEISKIKYFKKNSCAPFKISLLKLLILILWCNPVLFPKTCKYMKAVLKI